MRNLRKFIWKGSMQDKSNGYHQSLWFNAELLKNRVDIDFLGKCDTEDEMKPPPPPDN